MDEDGRLLLNGRTIFLRGASMHEDDPSTRRRTDSRADPQRRRAAAPAGGDDDPLPLPAPSAGARAGRPLRHLRVVGGARSTRWRDSLFRRAAVRRQAISMVRDMVNRDRSHPSVLVWSLGNENTSRPGTGFTRYIRSAARLVRQLDPTRLIGLAFPGYPTVGKQQLYTELDALGVNDYFGWYAGPAELDRGPRRPVRLPGAAARRLPAPGAVRDRVRRRGGRAWGRLPKRGPSPSSRTFSPTTWAFSPRSPS